MRSCKALRELVLILSFAALIVWPACAQAKSLHRAPRQRVSAATHAHQRRAPAAPQEQIACTVIGCQPVPRGCHPEPQRYFSGMTTGFDAVVCP
jgi:hypothetical protein